MFTPSVGTVNSAVAVEPSVTVIEDGLKVMPAIVVVLHALTTVTLREASGAVNEVDDYPALVTVIAFVRDTEYEPSWVNVVEYISKDGTTTEPANRIAVSVEPVIVCPYELVKRYPQAGTCV